MRASVALTVCAIVALSGCAEVMFKRGAGPGSMQSAQPSCREQSADETAYGNCLRAAGYVYAKPSTSGALFVAPTAETAAPFEGETVAPPPAADSAALTAHVEPAARAGVSFAPTTAPTPKSVVNPLREVTVASWWKLGGNAGGLEADQGSCAGQLGDAHKVAANSKLVTVGMRGCLNSKGWFVVGK